MRYERDGLHARPPADRSEALFVKSCQHNDAANMVAITKSLNTARNKGAAECPVVAMGSEVNENSSFSANGKSVGSPRAMRDWRECGQLS